MADLHPDVERIIAQFEATELHAARSGREVMLAFGAVIRDSRANSLAELDTELMANVDALMDSMPAYAPPINALNQVFAGFDEAKQANTPLPQYQSGTAQRIASYMNWSTYARARIAEIGRNLIPVDGTVFTFTLSETVLGTLTAAIDSGHRFRALLTESMPNQDGLDTARALAERGLHVEVSIDACLEELIPQADVMLVGAEAILSDGSAICKVGTYPCALAAEWFDVPVYVLVDSLKLHPVTLFGSRPYLDPIHETDVYGEGSNVSTGVAGHLFDRTPAELITAIVTENGLLHPSQVLARMLEMPISDSIVARLADRH